MTDLSTYCPTCKKTISIGDIHVDSQIAMCRRCRSSFRFQFAVDGNAANLAPPPPLATPRGVTVENDGHTVSVRYSWYGRSAYLWFVATIIMAGGATIATADLVDEPEVIPSWIVIVCSWILVAGIAYFCACCFITASIMEIEPSQVVFRTSPLPWFGACRLPLGDLANIACRFTYHTKSRHPDTALHELVGVLRNDRKRRFITMLPTPEHAWFFNERLRTAVAKYRR